MSKKTRREIKEKFKAGSQPTGQDFSDLADSIVNGLDDGIYKPTEQELPIRVISNGEEQNLLDFYDDDGIHGWRINQYPTDSSEGGVSVQRTGFNIEDSNSETRFFIKQDNGDIGLGTVNPTAKLHVVQASSDTDAFRVDDIDQDTTPFMINGSGSVKIRVNPDNYDESLSLDVRGPVRFVNTDNSRPSFEISKGTDISPYDGEPDLTVDTDGDSIADKPEPAFCVTKEGAVGIGTDAPEDGGVLIKGDITLSNSIEVDGDTTVKGNLTVQGNVYSKSTDETLTVQDVRLGDQDEDTVTVNGEIISAHSTGSLCIGDSVNIKEKTIIGSSYYQDTAVKVSGAAPSNGLLVEGNVGIGSVSPGAKLTVNGGAHIGGDSDPGDNNILVDGDIKAGGKVKQYYNGSYYDLLPAGAIVMWADSTVPYGWALCNGSNGTPNLIDKFILGSTDAQDVTDSHNDRSITVEHKLKTHNHTLTTPDHTHTAESITSHVHTVSSSNHKHSVTIEDHSHTVSIGGEHNHGGVGVNFYAGAVTGSRGASSNWQTLDGIATTSLEGEAIIETSDAGQGSYTTSAANGASAETSSNGGLNAVETTSVGDGAAPSDTFNFDVVPKHYKLVFIMKL